MDLNLFESLLYKDESESLDFKRDDYQLSLKNSEKKQDLLKDMLALANSWRETTAYLVLGIDDKKAAPRVVHGIPGGNLGRNLQQFVNSKTNRPLHFSYEEIVYQEKVVGVIAIPVQQRPVYAMNDFGQVKSYAVYVRRGDTNAIAAPDEVVKMAQSLLAAETQPQLSLQFADIATHNEIGYSVSLTCREIAIKEGEKVPTYSSGTIVGAYDNEEFYRDARDYLFDSQLFKPVGFSVANVSGKIAHNVILRMKVSSSEIELRCADDIGKKPSTRRNLVAKVLRFSDRNGVEVQKRGDFFDVKIKMGSIQPGVTEFSKEPIFFACCVSKTFEFSVAVAADNLMSPQQQKFTVNFTGEKVETPLDQLLDLFDGWR
ncbi:helix-turn-helix domain-containing protein [Terriglobus sp. TAA 43]|uniref:AlbA family DNA-binding domain-containing protein n=1 Tax=Terriglobus sp. TAA 43 TaxID=278961 RepID=UPI00068C5833|nr:ATP-binding protein [Terriglobus sp. TAA 43]